MEIFLKLIPLLALLVSFIIFMFQLDAKRIDDKIALQLDRVNKQLSLLYGPLYISYATGIFNHIAAKKQNLQFSFSNPEYLVLLQEVFIKTNSQINEVINTHADLFVGDVPRFCLKFCQHHIMLKTCLYDFQSNKIDFKILDKRVKESPHPKEELQSYTIAAFKILKERQSELLSKSRKLVDEKQLYKNIEEKKIEIMTLLTAGNFKYSGVPEWANDN